MRPLTPKLEKIAREELHETPDRIEQDLAILRVWIGQQKHLRARTTDAFLIAFLRRCRYSLEETKKRIEYYFTYYRIFPEVLANKSVNQRILDINRTGVYFYPENPKCNNETALLIARLGKYSPRKFYVREIMQFFMMTMEIMSLENDNATVCGICEIIDMAGVSIDNLRQYDKSTFKKFSDWILSCCPLRFREVYILNACKEIQRFFEWGNKLLTTRPFPLIILKSEEELYTHIPKVCLPEEYGGSNGHIGESVAYMEDLLLSYRSYFAEEYKFGTCEELRMGEVVPYEAEFGANGSFRKLPME